MTREIPLSKGLVTLVDDEDFEWFGALKWFAKPGASGFYAARVPQTNGVRGKMIYLHRSIMDPSDSEVVDHISGDTLDNRRANLRLCTLQQNSRNRRGLKGRDLPKGVYRPSPTMRIRGSYCARINVDGRGIYLGIFDCPIEAGRAYDAAAKIHFGDFARLNFPDEAAA